MTAFVDGGADEPVFPITSCAEHQFCGMGLRDYFAAKAMQTALQICHGDDYTGTYYAHCATVAYKMADTMLEARTA